MPVILRQSLRHLLPATLLIAAVSPAVAQPMLYTQRLPEGTVYIRLASTLTGSASVKTDFAGVVALGTEANRISPYFVAGNAGGKTVVLQVTGSKAGTARIQPRSGTFITVVLHEVAAGVTASLITDKPDYNQLKARLAFYNVDSDCGTGSLTNDGRPVFSAVSADSVQVRSLNPVRATVTAACRQEHAQPLDLGALQEGGLYSVWMMRLNGQLTSFLARDTIAPPQG